jgi:hypothetical protein
VPPPPVVLAHYGGVPEALTVVLPVLIFVGFLLLERRARRKERERARDSAERREPERLEPEP